jgi:hypothetical protein
VAVFTPPFSKEFLMTEARQEPKVGEKGAKAGEREVVTVQMRVKEGTKYVVTDEGRLADVGEVVTLTEAQAKNWKGMFDPLDAGTGDTLSKAAATGPDDSGKGGAPSPKTGPGGPGGPGGVGR